MRDGFIRLSIIVPVYNDAPNLAECLAALKAAAIPGCELIVVDDASTDDSSAVARRAGVGLIRLEQNSGPATARNRGAAAARGEILFFVDADVAVAQDAIRRVAAAFSEDPQLGAVFGSYDATPRAPGMVSQYRNLLHHFVHQQGNPAASTFWAGCGAVRRACFTEVGGFDGDQFRRPAIEDIELGHRLRRFGYRILLDKRLQGKHFKAWTLYSVVKTDILSRAVPWSFLVLEGSGAPNDLNLTWGQRVSGLLVLLAAAAMLLAPLHARLLAVSVVALVAVVALNWSLYRFFLARGGPWFLARVLPLHWLYYLYSSLTYLAVWVVVRARRVAPLRRYPRRAGDRLGRGRVRRDRTSGAPPPRHEAGALTDLTTRTLHVVRPEAPGAVISDPGNFTPYYVDALCSGLGRLGVPTWVVSSPALFSVVDPGGRYQVQHCFFPALNGRLGRVLRHRTRLRQAVKAVTYPAGIWRTWRILRGQPAGVLHVQWALVPFLDALLARALRARGWRIVYTVHDPLPGPDRWLAAWHRRRFLRCAEALIAHTPAIRQALVAGYPEVAGRVHVIPHGGIPHPLPTEADRARARLRLGLDGDRPLLLLFGMLKPYKGLEDLLAAMPGILARVPRCQLVVAGEALMPMRPIERQIDRLQLRDAVVLRSGFVPDAEVGAYFTAADLVVAPYRDIAASGVVVTAQGYGRAVLVTRVGGLPEFVQPDSCGLVVPPRDPDALAEAAGRALTNPDELSRMGQRAWKRIAKAHDWTEVARQTLALYQGLRTAPSESRPACRSNAR